MQTAVFLGVLAVAVGGGYLVARAMSFMEYFLNFIFSRLTSGVCGGHQLVLHHFNWKLAVNNPGDYRLGRGTHPAQPLCPEVLSGRVHVVAGRSDDAHGHRLLHV